jgi:hypothetical protein
VLGLLGLVAVVGPVSGTSAAEFSIVPGSFAVRLLDAEDNPENRAGSHPDRMQVDFAFETEGTGTSVRDIAVDMPPGFGGNPAAVPACPRLAHEEGIECPPDTQVGLIRFGSTGGPGTGLPIFRLEPAPGQIAAFTSKAGVDIPFELRLRPDDFGISFEASDLGEPSPSEGHIELWGIPADHQAGSPDQHRAFLTAPAVCGPLAFGLRARSHQENAPWLSATAQAGPLTGCEGLRFAPRLGLQLSNPVADSPTGVRMELSLPDDGEAGELAGAPMRDAIVELPPGLTISPGGATGLAVCTDAQLALGSATEAACPAVAKLGTVEFASAALPEPLQGAVYLGEPRGGERFRLFVVAPGPGIVLKFLAALHPDPASGRLVATLHDLPQVAIDRIAMNIDGGPAGLLASPLGCGPTSGVARFVPYGGGPAVESIAPVAIASVLPGLACPGSLPFDPRLLVSGSNPRAGRSSSFAALLQRRSGEQLPARFSLTLPAGLSAALGSIAPCPESVAVSGACPAASWVGAARAVFGSGSSEATLSGSAYLAGPYRHAPLSLVMAFPASLGPFDLGTVVLRARVQIDGRSGRVTVTTDQLPETIEGVSIRLRSIAFGLDRAGLVRNPTSCGPHAVDATIESQEGTAVQVATPYRVGGCKRLGFAPRIRLAVVGGQRQLRKHDHVGLRLSARLRRADASLRALSLSMPPALRLDISQLREICSRTDARLGLCPQGSRVGSALARTTLLPGPLKGSIYVVQPRDGGEPDLSVALAAAGLNLSVRGTTTTEHGRFVTKLAGLPDVPMSEFTMRLGSTGRALLSLDTDLCDGDRRRRLVSELVAKGQNGARLDSRVPIATTGQRCGQAGGG